MTHLHLGSLRINLRTEQNLRHPSPLVVKCLMSNRSRILLSSTLLVEAPSMAGVWGLGSNSGVGILDGFLLSHRKAHQTTERLAKVESPSLLLLSSLGLGGRRA
jgi:hypothetical protein